MKYLLLIAAIMTLTSATTISSSDDRVLRWRRLLSRRLLHDNDPIIRAVRQRAPLAHPAGPLFLVHERSVPIREWSGWGAATYGKDGG